MRQSFHRRRCGATTPAGAHLRSRRETLLLLASAGAARAWTPGPNPTADPPLRIALSESLVSDVNLSDARAAMQTWIKRMQGDFHLSVQIDPKIFSSTEDLVRGIRSGLLDAAALSVVEYRPIADLFDPQQLLVGDGASGPDEYLVLTRKDSPYQRLSNLRGQKLVVLKTPKMCVASAWLAALLDDGQLGSAETFFGSVASDSKASRVVLPVFFGQAEACLTARQAFDTMCELNPQVSNQLAVIARSPMLVTCFYAFRKGYPAAVRARFLTVHNLLLGNPSGRQLAALFQFDGMNIRDEGCLSGSLAILDKAEKIRARGGTQRITRR